MSHFPTWKTCSTIRRRDGFATDFDLLFTGMNRIKDVRYSALAAPFHLDSPARRSPCARYVMPMRHARKRRMCSTRSIDRLTSGSASATEILFMARFGLPRERAFDYSPRIFCAMRSRNALTYISNCARSVGRSINAMKSRKSRCSGVPSRCFASRNCRPHT